LFLLHFTRRIQPTAHLAPKQAQRLVELCLSSILIVNSSLLDIFHRLNAVFTTFDTQNTMHGTLSISKSPAARKTPPFVDFDRNFFPVGDI
jgi:hypothetical protein